MAEHLLSLWRVALLLLLYAALTIPVAALAERKGRSRRAAFAVCLIFSPIVGAAVYLILSDRTPRAEGNPNAAGTARIIRLPGQDRQAGL